MVYCCFTTQEKEMVYDINLYFLSITNKISDATLIHKTQSKLEPQTVVPKIKTLFPVN